MRIPLKIIPQEIIDTYDLNALVGDQGWIYMRTKKGMYGLKQAGIIANQELVKHMAPFGYNPVKHTPGLWVHNSRKTLFSLVVDDFCVQYLSTEDDDHFKTPSEPNTSSKSTWTRQYTLVLNSRGIMCTELSHCPCPVMYTKHYTDFSTSWEEEKSTLHIPLPPSSMDRRSNMQTRWTHQSISRIKKLTSFNRCAALFCIIPLPSITLFSLHSAIFPHSNPKPQQKLQNRWLNS